MDCIIRRVQEQPPEETQWSYTVVLKDDKNFLLVKRLDCSGGGWDTPFLLELRNNIGFSQLITVNPGQFELEIRPYIGLTSSLPRASWKIPPLIFETWKSKDTTPEMKIAQDSFRAQKGYSFQCFDDHQCAGLLHQYFGERYLNAYVLLTPGAYRADFWRYCMLYKFGGVYADAKTLLLRPLDEILRPQDELVLVKDVPATCLLNGFIACRPEHPLIKIAIDLCLERIESRSYGQDPLDVTGPHLFGRAFCSWLGQPVDRVTMNPGYTANIQFLGRSKDKKYIVSPEGERLLQKEYDSYYKNDIDVKYHYPNLWYMKAIYKDSNVFTKKPAT
jgi:hypothetical protein